MVLTLSVIFPFYSYLMLFPTIWIAISSQFSLIHVTIYNLHDSDHDQLGPGSIPLLFCRFGLSAIGPTRFRGDVLFLGVVVVGHGFNVSKPISPICFRTDLDKCLGVDKSVWDRW